MVSWKAGPSVLVDVPPLETTRDEIPDAVYYKSLGRLASCTRIYLNFT